MNDAINQHVAKFLESLSVEDRAKVAAEFAKNPEGTAQYLASIVTSAA